MIFLIFFPANFAPFHLLHCSLLQKICEFPFLNSVSPPRFEEILDFQSSSFRISQHTHTHKIIMSTGKKGPPGLLEIMRTGSVESNESSDSFGELRKSGDNRNLGDIICDRAFQLFDQDDSGDISMNEMKLLVSSLGKRMRFVSSPLAVSLAKYRELTIFFPFSQSRADP